MIGSVKEKNRRIIKKNIQASVYMEYLEEAKFKLKSR